MSWTLEEELKGLSDDFFGDLLNPIDFTLQDIDVGDDDTTSGEVEDWEAKFQQLGLPPMDVFTNFHSQFTSSCGISNKVSLVETVPALKQSSACGINSTLHQSPDTKVSKLCQSLSPVSVLESSAPQNFRSQRRTSPVKGMRSKRKRPTTLRFRYLHQFELSRPEMLTPGESGTKTYSASEQHAKKRRKISSKEARNSDGIVRKCSHCETTETPQWREGPNGPKTLCNACGVRFRSGRLVPEYRPASSPTFIPSVHSNSHRKIIEMRRKEGVQFHTGMYHGVISGA